MSLGGDVDKQQLPNIFFVTLGGTIASVPDASGREATPQLSAAELFASVPAVHEIAVLCCEAFRSYPSGDLRPEDILGLGELIEKQIAGGSDAVVITQGTDTLEETSFLLDIITRTDAPIVLTGAMRNAGLPGADGPANVLAAVRVAASPLARGVGPVVVFNDEIHLARYVRKTHTSSPATFRSANVGPIGWVTEDRVRIPLLPRTRTAHVPVRSSTSHSLPKVALVKLGLGSDADLIEQAVDLGYRGVVVEAFGGGHVPAATVHTLAATAQRIPVVFASRTGAGELYRDTYGFPGSEKDIITRGLISAGSLDSAKARLLLLVLLAAGIDGAEMQSYFSLS